MKYSVLLPLILSSLHGILQNFKYDIFITIISMEFIFISINFTILILYINSNIINYLSLFIAIICLSSAESAILVTILIKSNKIID